MPRGPDASLIEGREEVPTGVPRSQETAPPPWDNHMALGIFLLQGPRGALFLMREVPMCVGVAAFEALDELEGHVVRYRESLQVLCLSLFSERVHH